MTERMSFTDAAALDITTASAADLDRAWHAYASAISFHHADDSGKEWGQAEALMPRARAIEKALHSMGAPRPTGQYLMSEGDRIDWETGEWSRGWRYRKDAK